eukprot:1790087-Rhodomonas_salina.1
MARIEGWQDRAEGLCAPKTLETLQTFAKMMAESGRVAAAAQSSSSQKKARPPAMSKWQGPARLKP